MRKVTTNRTNGTRKRTGGTGRVDKKAGRNRSSPAKNGMMRIKVVATDGAGNGMVVEREVTWDTTKPTITNNFKEMPDPLTRPFAVTGSVDDAGSPTSLISWKFTITNWETKEVVKTVTGQGNPQGGVFAEINPAEYPYGQYTIAIEAVDLAGNTAVSQTTRYMDAVPPQLLSCTPVLDGRTLRIYVIVSDNSLRQVSAHWTILSSPMEGGRTEFGGAVNINEVHSLGITGLIKGLYTFELYFTDWAGNASTPHYFSVLVS